MARIDKPHDTLVRKMFENTEQVCAYFRSVLPQSLAEQIDWSSLAPMDGTLITPEMAKRYTDLLFSVKLGQQSGILCLLLEHQSEPEAWMPLRFLEYLSLAYTKWRDQHLSAQKLPIIIPVLLCHTKGGWGTPTSFEALFDDGSVVFELAKPYIPKFQHIVDDLTVQTDEEILARTTDAWATLALLLLKNARTIPNLAPWLVKVAPHLLRAIWAGPRGKSLLVTIIQYIFSVSDQTPPQDLAACVTNLLGKQAGDTSMTIADQLIAQGETRGKAEGATELRLAIADLCEVLGIELTSERNKQLNQLDLTGLGKLRVSIKSNRAWPDSGGS